MVPFIDNQLIEKRKIGTIRKEGEEKKLMPFMKERNISNKFIQMRDKRSVPFK